MVSENEDQSWTKYIYFLGLLQEKNYQQELKTAYDDSVNREQLYQN